MQKLPKHGIVGKRVIRMRLKAMKAAFPHTIPVLTGYLFLGFSYGVLMTTAGFPVWMAVLASITVFSGSMEFALVGMLLGSFNLFQAFLMTLMINARYMFYGIALLDRYKGLGLKKLYMIFGITDETFAIVCSTDAPQGVDQGQFMFFVTFLDQCYWLLGSALGALFGTLIQFNTKGLDFVMTAMFVVIFVEQWEKDKNHLSALIGVALPVICLLLFGADHFMIPAMFAILAGLTAVRKLLDKEEVAV